MPSLNCPKCRMRLTAPAEVLGQTVRCTGCGATFTASPTLSPYTEGLPPLPRDRRQLMLAGAVALTLLLTTVVVFGVSWLSEARTDGGTTSSGKIEPTPQQQLPPDPRDRKLFTQDGIPIELPGNETPGLFAKPQADEADFFSSHPSYEVKLSSITWFIEPGVRQLQIAYAFKSGFTPNPRLHVIKLRFDDGRTFDMPFDAALQPSGVLVLSLEAAITLRINLPIVEAWVERPAAGGGSVQVSNRVATQ